MKLDIDNMLLQGLFLLSAFVAFAFIFQRYRWRQRKRKGKSNWGFYPSSVSMGNALQELSVFTQPQAQHVIKEEAKDDAENDDEGGPKDPTAHLHRQLARIRKGEKLNRLTVRRTHRL